MAVITRYAVMRPQLIRMKGAAIALLPEMLSRKRLFNSTPPGSGNRAQGADPEASFQRGEEVCSP
jgi:hypothetical protein